MNQEKKASAQASFDLSGRRAVVTGASRGIGRALAIGLAGAGAEVLCVARSEEGLAETLTGVEACAGSARSCVADVASDDGIDAVVEAAAGLGGLDVLVNNAGADHDSPLEEMPLEAWNRLHDINVTAAFRLCQRTAGMLADDGGGKVINIASMLAQVAAPEASAYIATKAALVGFTRATALEWARRNVQVNAIGPGFIQTEMTAGLWQEESLDRWVTSRTPMRRWGQPDDLVGAAVFLASSASDFITGQLLIVDGGYTIQ